MRYAVIALSTLLLLGPVNMLFASSDEQLIAHMDALSDILTAAGSAVDEIYNTNDQLDKGTITLDDAKMHISEQYELFKAEAEKFKQLDTPQEFADHKGSVEQWFSVSEEAFQLMLSSIDEETAGKQEELKSTLYQLFGKLDQEWQLYNDSYENYKQVLLDRGIQYDQSSQ
jgi:hypothetical protein